jgi:dTDP-4-dehydrorhamnose reductase
MLRLAREREEVAVVADQHGSPTSAFDIADGIISVGSNLLARPDETDLRGIFHMTGSGFATWADFATEIFQQSARFGGPAARVRPITTADYPTPAKRPTNSRIDGSKLARIHGVTLPVWQTSLELCVRRLIEEARAQETHP